MLFDIKEAFISVTKENNFREKLLLGTFLVMLANFLSTISFRHNSIAPGTQNSILNNPLLLLVLLGGFGVLFVLMCYLLAFLHNKVNNKEMPAWSELSKYFVKGLKLLFSYAVFFLPLFVLYEIMFYFMISSVSAGVLGTKPYIFMIFRVVFILIWFVFTFISILQTAVFAKNLKIRDFFNFAKGYQTLCGNFWVFLLFVIVVFIFMLFWFLLSFVVKTSGVYAYLIMLLVSSPVFYIMTVYVDLLSQWVKKSGMEYEFS